MILNHKEMAPLLFKLCRGREILVCDALLYNRWMRGLSRLTSEAELEQFLKLWEQIQGIFISQQHDQISWVPKANGAYSAKSAYNSQFLGRIKQPHLQRAWTTKVEGKVKFYMWLLLQNRNWTADQLLKKKASLQ